MGRQLRYVAELDGQWVALLGWNVAAYHLRGRDEWLGWTVEQLLRRRKFVVQNSRFLLLADRGRWPNLASRVLSLCGRRLSRDWEEAFGHPVLAVESFVDPERFAGTCYRAAGWEILGRTQGSRRHHRDFYVDDATPKELWVRCLHPKARKWLRAPALPPRYAPHEDPAWHCRYTAAQCQTLWERFNHLLDVRKRKGRLHSLASILTIGAVATLCGVRGTRAIADFAEHLNPTQLRLLHCYYSQTRKRHEPPSEPTVRRVLNLVPAADFDREVAAWLAKQDGPLRRVAVDGKPVKKARAPDGRALHLVAAVTHDSAWLVAQRPVDEKSNEITALRPMLQDVDLRGVVVTSDAIQTQQDAARFLTQEKGADYFLSLKGNQPSVQAAAARSLARAFPPAVPPQARSEGKEHGRLELRELWAATVTPEEAGFCSAAQVVRIHRHFTQRSTGKQSDETVLAISSLPPLPDPAANARQLLDIARGHWTLSNGNHYVRDRTYDEDLCQVRDPNSARILATLRSLARFMAKKGVHRPRSEHHKTTPALNRFCQAHRTLAIRWLKT